MRKYLTRLCKNIVSEKFNAQNYRTKKSYYGTDICVEPIVCGLYCNGFTLDVFAKQCYKIKYDYEFGGLWINDKPWKDYINLLYLEENDIRHSENPVWEDKPRSVELETYTNGGEDMIINLEEGKMDYSWLASKNTALIRMANILYKDRFNGNTQLNWDYSEYDVFGRKMFPKKHLITLTTPDKEVKLGMTLNYLGNDTEWDARTEVSNKYREVTVDEILRRFMAL